MRDTQVPVNMAVFAQPVSEAAWHTRPSWAVWGTEDKAFDQAMLRHMAERAGATITTIEGSHAVYLTQAETVADVIMSAAEKVRADRDPSRWWRVVGTGRYTPRPRATARTLPAGSPILRRLPRPQSRAPEHLDDVMQNGAHRCVFV